jgi:excisionase family DNA binding protein
MENTPASEWISVPEAARLKGVAESSVRVAIQAGRLTGAKVGRSYIVRRRDVEAWRPGPQGPKRSRSAEGGKPARGLLADARAVKEGPAQPTREEILAFLQANPQEQQHLLQQAARSDRESAFCRAARLKESLSRFVRRGVSTEEYLWEKRAEIELEQRRADSHDA